MKISITRKHTKAPRLILSAIAVIAIAIGVFSYLQPTSRAANLSSFDPGNIMSDYVMGNKNSMTEAQIQTFLESKNACNNTNISRASIYHKVKNGKFVCMYEDTFDGETAAHIIWQAGQDYSINPQVIIVLLQKEQGLITDTWPNSIQYNKATGYGCPDTAPCDTQYYGLKNQIRKAAALYRTVLDGGWSNYPVGNNYVQYHPNAACGGTTINIKNRATSALYRYTPYQPNQAALNAGYGTGDSCSAYGNRNFWLYFTDWFGATNSIEIRGSIGVKYNSIDGVNLLGSPLQVEQGDGSGFWWQRFANGYIVGSARTGYFVSKGSIREKWGSLGYQNGYLKLPLSDERYDAKNKSWSQIYEGGKVISHSSGAYRIVVKDPILKVYEELNDKYHTPIEDDHQDAQGFKWQEFTNGYIVGTLDTGFFESSGSIRLKWASSGYQSSPVGLPTSNIQETSSGCYKQEYTKGTIEGCNGKYDITLD